MSLQQKERTESRSFAPWQSAESPERILLIRFHAIGDVALVLPAAAAMRALHPSSRIDLLTSPQAEGLASATALFDRVLAPPFPARRGGRALYALRTGFSVRASGYDVILDLQRNSMSRIIRRIASPPSWGEFDRYAPVSAWQRIVDTCRRTGFACDEHPQSVPIRAERLHASRQLLARHGRITGKTLVMFNPAGLWTTRNWPVENYVELGMQWQRRSPVQFLLLGTDRMRAKAEAIVRGLGNDVINLTAATSLADAFACVAAADIMISEDSGLMHAAWAAGVPIVALFGSSRHDWSAPFGSRSVTLHAGDLPCGACMDPSCRFGDVHCLTRHTPAVVLDQALHLLQQTSQTTTD